MSSVAEVRTAIVAAMNTVSGVGVVQRYERYARRLEDFKGFYVSNDRLLGWYVRRTGTRESSPAVGRYVIVHDWLIRGFMALDDSAGTEETFDALIEDVRDAFRADETLGGVVKTIVVGQRAGVQVSDEQLVMFGGVLCHSARLLLSTEDYR